MISKEDLYIVGLVIGAIVATNVVAMVLFILFAKLPNGKLKETIRGIIYELDRFADNMENQQKRQEAIGAINDVLGWRRILIPRSIIGWIIDTEVAAVRKMQSATDTPNLHQEVDTNGTDQGNKPMV